MNFPIPKMMAKNGLKHHTILWLFVMAILACGCAPTMNNKMGVYRYTGDQAITHALDEAAKSPSKNMPEIQLKIAVACDSILLYLNDLDSGREDTVCSKVFSRLNAYVPKELTPYLEELQDKIEKKIESGDSTYPVKPEILKSIRSLVVGIQSGDAAWKMKDAVMQDKDRHLYYYFWFLFPSLLYI